MKQWIFVIFLFFFLFIIHSSKDKHSNDTTFHSTHSQRFKSTFVFSLVCCFLLSKISSAHQILDITVVPLLKIIIKQNIQGECL